MDQVESSTRIVLALLIDANNMTVNKQRRRQSYSYKWRLFSKGRISRLPVGSYRSDQMETQVIDIYDKKKNSDERLKSKIPRDKC